MSDDAPPVTPRPAASGVIVRMADEGPRVLMGRRGSATRFMSNRVVFPGGTVDPEDRDLGDTVLAEPTARRLRHDDHGVAPSALIWALTREVFEETGFLIAPRADAPPGAAAETASWPALVQAGYRPDSARFRFFFRAITPPRMDMRFDARFFLIAADDLSGPLDDLTRGSGELEDLRWLSLEETREARLPRVTRMVLAEAEAILRQPELDRPVQYFHQTADGRQVTGEIG